MKKVQKFKMMMEKRYGNGFELVLCSIYNGDLEQMYHEFALRKECYPYQSYKSTFNLCLRKLNERSDK